MARDFFQKWSALRDTRTEAMEELGLDTRIAVQQMAPSCALRKRAPT
ncbi:hypothetical protein MY10362_000280 [Beauveria mimosiformis]